MAVKKYKPTTPGQRGMTGYTFEEITKDPRRNDRLIVHSRKSWRPQYLLVVSPYAIAAAAIAAIIRMVDFKREKHDIPAKVAAIEYDPNRTARLALLFYADGEKRYIIAPLGI